MTLLFGCNRTGSSLILSRRRCCGAHLASGSTNFRSPVPGFQLARMIMPSAFVRDHGICIDTDASMPTHVAKTVSSCFAILRHLRSVRRSVSKPVMQSLVVALVLTSLDYENATLVRLADQSLSKLQSVLNAAARLIFLSPKFDYVTSLLRELHWLGFPERINYKLALLVFKCLNGLAPPYLAYEFRRVADTESRQRNS